MMDLNKLTTEQINGYSAAEGVKALEILRYDGDSAQSGITAGILILWSTGTATVSTE